MSIAPLHNNHLFNVSDETDISAFYNKLSILAQHIPKNILIISGNMKDQIGKDGNNEFCLHNLWSRNGKYLANFSLKNRFACQDIKFQKREEKQWIYTYPKILKHSFS